MVKSFEIVNCFDQAIIHGDCHPPILIPANLFLKDSLFHAHFVLEKTLYGQKHQKTNHDNGVKRVTSKEF